ncbi:hypothetical protein FJT64_021959 [Amphibalanus amphitrite]|uniref:Uncharacterized protein n=1 Tax=Amphibalanus amphitrite TaxID=1232801 RepID=A0A6A4WS91_AMPAM|nr:hypothetical protein FJT64_021959 [Amphibalanus amphitrite]
MEIDQSIFGAFIRVMVVAVNACRTAPEGSAGRLLSLLDQLRLPDAGALPDWGLHPGMLLGAARKTVLENAHQLKTKDAVFRSIYVKKDVHPIVRKELDRLRDATKREKERPENQGKNVRYDYRERKVYVDDVVVDSYQVPAETLVGLQNLLVHLRDVSAENAHVYQYRLWDAKRVKVETAQNRGVSPDGAAGYRDGLRRTTNGHPLSAEEVQKVVSRVNQLSS